MEIYVVLDATNYPIDAFIDGTKARDYVQDHNDKMAERSYYWRLIILMAKG